MYSDYLRIGGIEIANSTRLAAYLESVGSPLTDYGNCGCPTLTPEVLGEDGPYTNPVDDEAPWYDVDVPESAEFAGFMVLSVEGMDDFPVTRQTTTAVSGGASLGPSRVQGRTITVTGVLLGSTCCGVQYGLQFLSEALAGCSGGSCDGDCLEVFSCCPGDEDLTPQQFTDRYRRTLRRVVLAEGPKVLERTGNGCRSGECTLGADLLTVEFVLVAGTPWLWADVMPVLEMPLRPPGAGDCPEWCLVTRGEEAPDGCACCRLGSCSDPVVSSQSVTCMLDTPPPAPRAPDTCYCLPIAAERQCFELDLTTRPGWSVDVPVITLRAGSYDLRDVTISFYERTPAHGTFTCEEIADYERCDPHSVYTAAFVPAGTAVVIDGQVSRALVECAPLCETSPYIFGAEGGPASYKPIDCATYCVCIETDALDPPHATAMLTIGVSGRGL
ncbi:hypothetical protein [Streptomyces sp. H27-H5]|uniref:hypothetical protein n=1 Tax=Streptomyces sp. H27-H5 TaxID=2996460 RepID=UPI00226E0C82|nr:hypothetical protein [Streptomyces sp. H27-H5]MCY0957751.1 hypothetical protein [Streptomyces sp. H27-H5]